MLPELYTEFDAGQWAGLVENMTVYDKERIAWKLTCGMKIEARDEYYAVGFEDLTGLFVFRVCLEIIKNKEYDT